jgi:hypothetical protein
MFGNTVFGDIDKYESSATGFDTIELTANRHTHTRHLHLNLPSPKFDARLKFRPDLTMVKLETSLMNNVDLQPGKIGNARRSQRVYVGVDVAVRWYGVPTPTLTRTIVVNAHGALLSLSEKAGIGQQLMLKNVRTQEELPCRVASVSVHETIPAIAVEFTEPAPRFWRIAFPPEDWTPRSPEAKGHTVPRPAAPKMSK